MSECATKYEAKTSQYRESSLMANFSLSFGAIMSTKQHPCVSDMAPE